MKLDQDFINRVERYLARQLDLEGFRISSADQISGAGLSRSVVLLMATSKDAGPQSFILLMEKADSPVPPNSHAEYLAMRALSAFPGLRVPHAYCKEDSEKPLGRPFIVTEWLPGATNPQHLMNEEHLPHARSIALQAFEILGSLATIDVDAIDLGPSIRAPSSADVHMHELDRMERLLRENDASDRPITSAALRHLHRTAPAPPTKISIAHGDYRIGNYLFDTSGVTGVIDWEMVHKGDPLEDLAWAMLPNWEFAAHPKLVSGLLTHQEAIEAWERTSGLMVDREALDWWILFCHIKLLSIGVSSRHMFATGKTREIVMGLVGLCAPAKGESHMARILERQWA